MNYILFSSDTPLTIRAISGRSWDGSLEYSYDNQIWNFWEGEAITNNHIYMRGMGNSVVSYGYAWKIMGENIRCQGNVENLLNYQAVQQNFHPKMNSYCFAQLFAFCEGLIEAPDLPSLELAEYCYAGMFLSCTALSKPPLQLPAKKLADGCYSLMFASCSQLAVTPELPAMKLADNCYSGMFKLCIALEKTPELPATILARSCYANMFGGCTSLKHISELPVINLSIGCYDNMFFGCSSLEEISSFFVQNFIQEYYHEMFTNCENLQNTCMFSDILVAKEAIMNGMFTDCNSLKYINTTKQKYDIEMLKLL